MLRALHLTNWKSFGDTTEIPLGQLTFLIGPNGSGKSNVLDAMRFLRGTALGYPAEEVLRGTTEPHGRGWPGVRGGEAETTRVGATKLTTGLSFVAPIQGTEIARFSVGFAAENTLGSQWFDGFDGHLTTSGSASSSAGHLVLSMRDFIFELRRSEHIKPQASIALTWLEGLLRHSTHMLDLQPQRMTGYAPVKATTLGDSGENLSAVLRACSPSKLEDIEDWLEELGGPSVKGIRFEETQLGDVLFFLEEIDGRRVSARVASDGTLRFLGLVTAILTAPEGSVLVMEEPDTGLHPARLGLLAELLQDTAKRRKLQILATTHSSTLLAYLRPEVLGEAVALRRERDTGESRASPLAAIPYFETLRDSDHLAQLLSTGWVEHAQ